MVKSNIPPLPGEMKKVETGCGIDVWIGNQWIDLKDAMELTFNIQAEDQETISDSVISMKLRKDE